MSIYNNCLYINSPIDKLTIAFARTINTIHSSQLEVCLRLVCSRYTIPPAPTGVTLVRFSCDVCKCLICLAPLPPKEQSCYVLGLGLPPPPKGGNVYGQIYPLLGAGGKIS